MVSLMSIGTLLGALSGAYTADWWGRRRSLSFGVCVFIIGNIIQITAMNSWVHMMMGRFVAGLGVGNLSVGVPMFQSECSPKEIRGAVVASYQLMITFGILISNLINFGVRNIQESDASWRIVIGLGIAFACPLGLGILVVPESPRWLAGRHDWEGARLAMARLRGMKNDPNNELVENDLQEMFKVLEEESKTGTGTWAECFTGSSGIPKTVYRTFLGIFIHFLQQWTGVNYFVSVHFIQLGLGLYLIWCLVLLWSYDFRICRYRGPNHDTAHSRSCQCCSHLLRSVCCRKVRKALAVVHRCPVASCLACGLRVRWHSCATRHKPHHWYRHDRICVHVHCLFCRSKCSQLLYHHFAKVVLTCHRRGDLWPGASSENCSL